jgi:hypothetical protein
LAILEEAGGGPLETFEIAGGSVRSKPSYVSALCTLASRKLIIDLGYRGPPSPAGRSGRRRWATPEKAKTICDLSEVDSASATPGPWEEAVVRRVTGRQFGRNQLRILFDAPAADEEGLVVMWRTHQQHDSRLEVIRHTVLSLWHQGWILIDRDGIKTMFDARSAPGGRIHFRAVWLSAAGEALVARIRAALDAARPAGGDQAGGSAADKRAA